MKLTDDMKKVMVHRTLNGTAMLYFAVSICCMVLPFLRNNTQNVSILQICGLVLFVFVCVPRLQYIWDVMHDKVTITEFVVSSKERDSTGRRYGFLYFGSAEWRKEERHKVLLRIYNETNVGDKGIYVVTKPMRTYYFMKEFEK